MFLSKTGGLGYTYFIDDDDDMMRFQIILSFSIDQIIVYIAMCYRVFWNKRALRWRKLLRLWNR